MDLWIRKGKRGKERKTWQEKFQISADSYNFSSLSLERSSCLEPTDIEIGDVQKSTNEFTEIKWRIADFLQLPFSTARSCKSAIFNVKNDSFYIKMFPDTDCIFVQSFHVQLWSTDAKREYPLEYHSGLKKNNGNVELLVKGTLERNKQNTDILKIHLSEIKERKSELLLSDVLTISCALKPQTDSKRHSNQPFVLDKTKPLQLIRLDKLSQNFKDVFDDKETCDVILKVKDKEYKAHKLVLIARSKVFAANFKHDTLEKQTGIITIEDCDPDSFQDFLKYLYSGKLEEISCRRALNLYYTSDKYDIEELRIFCVEYLMQCLTVENLCEIVVFADKYEEKELFSRTQTFFNENASKIFETSEWLDLMRQDNRLANKLLIEMSKEY